MFSSNPHSRETILRHGRSRRARRRFGAHCMLLQGARTPTLHAPDSTAAGATPPAPANSVAATTPTAAALPGALTKPIDQYTGDEFYDFVQKLKWGGGVEKARKCKGDPGCSGTKPSKETKVRVDAVDGQDSISDDHAAGERCRRGTRDQSRLARRRALRLQGRQEVRVLSDRVAWHGRGRHVARSRSSTRRRALAGTPASGPVRSSRAIIPSDRDASTARTSTRAPTLSRRTRRRHPTC